MKRLILATLLLASQASAQSVIANAQIANAVLGIPAAGWSPVFVDAIKASNASAPNNPQSLSVTTDWSVASGSLIVASCAHNSGSATSITFSSSPSYTWATHVQQAVFSEETLAIGSAIATGAGAVTVTCTANSGSGGGADISVAEFSGIGASRTAINTGTGTNYSTAPSAGNLAGGSGTGLIYVSSIFSYNTALGTTTAPSGWSKTVDMCTETPNGYAPANCWAYYVGTGTQATTWTSDEITWYAIGVVLGP